MMLWKRTAAALLLYLVTTCSAEISAAQPRPQTIIRPAPGSTAAGSRTLANNAASASANASSGGAGAGAYAWSQWGAWSPCSRTCGGGVSVQERQCLPSDTNRWLRGRKRRRLPPGLQPNHKLYQESGPTSYAVNRLDPNRTHEHEPTLRRDVTLQRQLAEERRRKEGWRSDAGSPPTKTDENKNQYDRSDESKRITEDKGITEEIERAEMLNERRSTEGRENQVQSGERLQGRRRVHRWAREVRNVEFGCRGLAKRYHECNTAPCRGPAREPRVEQCASYDRRPFKGRFYTWVPYVDAESPCTLNCRPRGQQFYASLGLVADGTPCTRPGFRAICVQGSCKVVGREGVLSTSSSRDLRCGRRLVSGLFSRPRLPLGYSHIATVPPGACRLNISELQPSENYIALKVTNGSFIMNGEFAVSSPGTYEAAGAQFVYRRVAGVETIYTHGPTMQSLDIMILYQHPNPSIKYEYLTDTLPDEAVVGGTSPEVVPAGATHHMHRHHGTDPHTKSLSTPNQSDLPKDNTAGIRRFNWRILSFTPCSRTCGGGIQMGKFRCVEEGNGREVSPVHCSGALPATRRRRCNMIACPPRWRTTAWSTCPQCGPATQTRNVGCVQDHSRGLTKISDSKCSQPMPTGTQLCNIPSCDSNAIPSEPRGQDTRRQVHERDHTERFHAAPPRPPLSRPYNRTDRIDTDNDISAVLGPEYFSAAGGWLYTEWSECVGWCVGGGVRSRGVRCADPAGCAAARAPLPSESCMPRAACEPHTTHWFTGDWSACSAECGGRQVRAVVCLGGAGRRARDAACSEPRPQSERACGSNCQPTWFLSDWSQCTGACGAGVQSRTVWCARGGDASSAAAREAECSSPRPPSRRACDPPRCEPGAPPAAAPPPPALPDVPRAYAPPPPPPPQQHTTPDPQRIPRNQNQNPRTSPLDEHHNNPGVTGGGGGAGGCTDRLSSCALAVQARLCHYHYYSQYCCRSCNSKP